MTKNEKDALENRLVLIFTVALVSLFVMLLLYRGLNGSSAISTTMGFVNLMMGLFVVSIITLIILAKTRYKNKPILVKKLFHWMYFSIVGFFVAFVIYPNSVLTGIKNIFRINEVAFTNVFAFANHFTQRKAIPVLAALIIVYVVVEFVVYYVTLSKDRKSKLNKGKKKGV